MKFQLAGLLATLTVAELLEITSIEHFDEVITNSPDHWFVGVYCDDCVPCQKLAPIYEKLESEYPHLREFEHG